VDTAQTFYIADSGNFAIRKIYGGRTCFTIFLKPLHRICVGVVSTIGNIGGGLAVDGFFGAGATFQLPMNMSITTDGTLYVIDAEKVRMVSTAGTEQLFVY
jgi:hypothetical protein